VKMLLFRKFGLITLLSASILPAANAADIFNSKSMTSVRKLSGNSMLRSREDREITLFSLNSQNPSAPSGQFRFLVQGGLHGDEKLTSSFVVWLADRFNKGKSLLNSLPASEISVDFVPVVNPDGSRINSRYNSRDVNLNRNFGTLWGLSRENPGVQSFSEPEAQAVKYLLDNRNYAAAVDVHGYINWVVAPSMPTQVGIRDLNRAKRYSTWIEKIGKEISLLNRYEIRTAGELGDGGAFEDYAFWSANTLSFCLEMFSRERFSEPRSWAGFMMRKDSFEMYENFIARMFEHAIDMERSGTAITQNAKTPRSATN
jgi:hypothetical protein